MIKINVKAHCARRKHDVGRKNGQQLILPEISPRICYAPKYSIVAIALVAIVLGGCVNSLNNVKTEEVKNEPKPISAEQRYVGGECNSAKRLKGLNLASEALNIKYSTYVEKKGSMDTATQGKLLELLQERGNQLQAFDQELKPLCQAYAACEYQAITTKQGCSTFKIKFLETNKKIDKFTKQVKKIKIK